MGTLFKRGKNWYIDVRNQGRRIRKRVGTSKEVAELALKDAEVKIAKQEFGFYKPEVAIETFLAEYFEFSRTNHSVNTTKRYKAVIDNFRLFLEDHPDVTNLSHINHSLIETYKSYRRDHWLGSSVNGKTRVARKRDGVQPGARAKTINFELNALRTILYEAVKRGYLSENPLKGVRKLKVEDSKRIRVLTPVEMGTLLDHTPDDLRPIFQTFLLTGMRKGELENLTWDDVDFRQRKIKVQRKPFWRPKTGEREISIHSDLLPILRRLKAENSKKLKSDFVFPHKDGSRIKTKLRERLMKVARKAGIEDLSSIHAFRHTFATQLLQNGVQFPELKEILGHKDINTTLMYLHFAPHHLAQAVDKMKL